MQAYLNLTKEFESSQNMSSLRILKKRALDRTLVYWFGIVGRKWVSSCLYICVLIKHSKFVTVLLFLHRNFFAKAMVDQTGNPLRSKFAPSFLAAFTTSISYLKSARKVYDRCSKLVDRQWTFWAHALVAAVRTAQLPYWQPPCSHFHVPLGNAWFYCLQDEPISGSARCARSRRARYLSRIFWEIGRSSGYIRRTCEYIILIV